MTMGERPLFIEYLNNNKESLNTIRQQNQFSTTRNRLHPLDILYITGNKSFRIADRARATLGRLRANLGFGGSRTRRQNRKTKSQKKRITYKKRKVFTRHSYRPLLSTNVSTKRRHTHRI
jgi:hypothetical protein